MGSTHRTYADASSYDNFGLFDHAFLLRKRKARSRQITERSMSKLQLVCAKQLDTALVLALAMFPNQEHECIQTMVEVSMPSCPLAVGDLVQGKYQIDAVLGEGGMGVVFAATHVELHCPVALKVIRQELSQEPELVARLMLEARAAAQIKSEHVCRVLDVGRLDSGAPFVVMEHLRGRNLGSVLRAKGRFPEQVAVDYLLQACEAIAEAHRAGVIHRDLKPENLFLAEFPDGHRAIKVLDFGISKTAGTFVKSAGHNLTNPSSAMGSPHYMAPEQMSAARDVDIRADIWALGAILYELLTGRLAFEGDTLPVVCAAVLQSQPKPINYAIDLSTNLEPIILGCLAKDRQQRPCSVADLAQQIAPFGSSQAAESVARIRRLLEVASIRSDAETHDSSGTLFSPRASGTPREVSAQRERVVRTPVETAAGVTSTKESEFSSASNSTARRFRWPLLFAALSLLGGLFVARSILSVGRPNTVGPTSNVSGSDTHSSSFGTTETLPVTPQPLPVGVIEPVSPVGPVTNAPTATTLSPTDALPTPLPASKPLPNATQQRIPAPAGKSLPGILKAKANKTDPYNLDNFGGRR